MDPRESYIALNMMDGIGPVKVRAMIDVLGSPEAIFRATEADLTRVRGIGPELARRILTAPQTLNMAGEQRRADRAGTGRRPSSGAHPGGDAGWALT